MYNQVGPMNSKLSIGTAIRSQTTGVFVPFIIFGQTNGTNAVTLDTPNYPFKICSWWLQGLNTTAGNITIDKNSSAVGTIAKGTADHALVVGQIDDESELEFFDTDDVLTIESSTGGNANVYILCARVA